MGMSITTNLERNKGEENLSKILQALIKKKEVWTQKQGSYDPMENPMQPKLPFQTQNPHKHKNLGTIRNQ